MLASILQTCILEVEFLNFALHNSILFDLILKVIIVNIKSKLILLKSEKWLLFYLK